MTPILTAEDYQHTQEILHDLELQLAAVENCELDLSHLAEARKSYRSMMRECLRELSHYEEDLQESGHPTLANGVPDASAEPAHVG